MMEPDGASLNEHGPWGGDKGASGPGARKPSALEALIRRGRGLGAPGGPRLPGLLDGGPLWGWGVAALLLLWIAFTSVHTIGPQQRGVVTRLGRYVATLDPGLRMTLPAPFDIVRKLDVDNIHAIDIDSSAGEGEAGGSGGGQNLVLTGDENLINLAYTVRWNIRDPELYMFEIADPKGTIREVAESAMREAIARVTLNDAIGAQRGQIEARVAARMQDILDDYHSGVAIQGVSIRQADPPAEVMDAFKDVLAAQQKAQSYLNNAHAYSTQVNARAQGEAVAFDQVYEQYRLAPEVTRRRMYYETMEKVLAKTDKTIVETNVTPYLPIPAKPAK